MQNRHSENTSGLIFWAIVLPIVVFVATKHSWFDPISHGEKAIFWTNVTVAVGTLALAAVTTWNIRQTKEVIAGEDRRHQQQFAPLVQFHDPRHSGVALPGFAGFNIGNGLAVNVRISVRGTLHYLVPTGPEVSLDTLTIKLGESIKFYQAPDGSRYRTPLEKRSEPFDRIYTCSAIEASDRYADFPYAQFAEKQKWDGWVEYAQVAAIYFDMFGNEYRTIYHDKEIATYIWEQPSYLQVSMRPNRSRDGRQA